MFFNASQVKENRLSNFDSLDAVPTLTSKLSLKLKVVCLSMKRKCEEASWLEMMVVDMKVRLLMINNFYYWQPDNWNSLVHDYMMVSLDKSRTIIDQSWKGKGLWTNQIKSKVNGSSFILLLQVIKSNHVHTLSFFFLSLKNNRKCSSSASTNLSVG